MRKSLSLLVATVFALSSFGIGQAGARGNLTSTSPMAQARSAGIKFAPAQIREANRRKRQTIKARYPQAIGAGGDPRLARLNQDLRKFIGKEVQKFRTDAQPPEERTFSAGSTFESKYSVRHAADGFISIAFLIQAYYEGAVHGSYNTIVFNYDLTSGRMLKLADLFKPNSDYLKPISDYSVEALRKEKGPDPDMEEIRSGAGPKEENYQSWNVTRAGLEINFDPYQVGSYAEGPHEVIIPYSVLRGVINPAGPLAKIVGVASRISPGEELKDTGAEKTETGAAATVSNPRLPRSPVSDGPGIGSGVGSGEGVGIGQAVGPGKKSPSYLDDVYNRLHYPDGIYRPSDVDVRARIIFKPEAQYSEEARKNDVSGRVVLRAVLSATGQVTKMWVLSGLPYGLSEKAMQAARMIKFIPAMKDGQAVSQFINLEYIFDDPH